MSNILILLSMIFLHIVDDYYLQGWLASAKQKEWWVKNAPNPIYAKDYIWVLLMHAFSWTFMVMLPIVIVSGFKIDSGYLSFFVFNFVMHGSVDHIKANLKLINLWSDQITHMIQIVTTWIFLIVLV